VTDIAIWCARSSLEVAHDLIGCELLVDGVGGRIVECEAYARDDPASHAFPGPTPRNASMFGPAGRVYVYRSYGLHWMLNIVCGARVGAGEAVLIRALEPTAGLELMRERRGREAAAELCRGPGRLGQALAIGPDLDGEPIGAGRIELRLATPSGPVARTPRIGISRARELPWRFVLEGSPYVSPFRRSRSA
jgi:DNA-3-methyladenine glycosylase